MTCAPGRRPPQRRRGVAGVDRDGDVPRGVLVHDRGARADVGERPPVARGERGVARAHDERLAEPEPGRRRGRRARRAATRCRSRRRRPRYASSEAVADPRARQVERDELDRLQRPAGRTPAARRLPAAPRPGRTGRARGTSPTPAPAATASRRSRPPPRSRRTARRPESRSPCPARPGRRSSSAVRSAIDPPRRPHLGIDDRDVHARRRVRERALRARARPCSDPVPRDPVREVDHARLRARSARSPRGTTPTNSSPSP